MSDQEKAEEVPTSSADVYPAPIALGFYDGEPAVASSASAPVIMLPDNFPDTERSVTVCNKDVRDAQAVRGSCGLYNLGNTCFMNSGLQCLMSTVPLVTFFLEHLQQESAASHAYDHTLLGQFQQLFAKVWSGQFATVHPKEFKSTLGVYCSQFQDYRQHDCQEFLALLLDTLHEQLNVRYTSTNQNTEAEQSGQKQPITFEHNIINSASSSSHPRKEFCNLDQSEHVGTSTTQTQLTFDNITKESRDYKNAANSFDCLKDTQEKDKNRSNLVSFTVNPISEDSNHSSVSEHSSESDQCTVIQNLKLRSSPVVSQSSDTFTSKYSNLASGKEQFVTSSVDGGRGEGSEAESLANENFKRVHSLQDLKTEHQMFGEDMRMSKAFSDNDLVKQASGDMEEDVEFEAFESVPSFSSAKQGAMCEDAHEKQDSVQEPLVLNNALSTTSVPSLEDLYSKETKTLNTNVLSSEFIDSSIAVDSEKFAKHDNTAGRPEVIEEEDVMNNIVEATTSDKGGFEPKRIKDVNVRANKKSRTPNEACSSTCIEANDKEDCFAVNSVKRMKFEGTEKNLQMQEMSKIQKKRLIFGDLKANRNAINAKESDVMMDIRHVGNAREIDSDSDSEARDDHDMDVEINLSDDEDKGGASGRRLGTGDATGAGQGRYTAAEVLAAEEAWQKYLNRNDSVVVNTFQGQFKSTVVCSDCDQVSVTFEPFMYLSVPIPHAMERQLCVIFIPLSGPPTQYLLTLHKHDKVQRAKEQLRALIGRDNCDVIMTEVLNWHISRILEDHTVLRFINDTSRSIYGFEMDTSVNAEETSTPTTQNPTSSTGSHDVMSPGDVFSHMGSFSAGSSTYNSQTSYGSHEFTAGLLDTDPVDYQADDFKVTSGGGSSGLEMMGTGVWDWAERGDDNNKRRGSLETEVGGEWPMADSTTTANSMTVSEDENSAGTVMVEQGDNSVSSTSAVAPPAVGAADEWKSCAICLEELTDSELMVHTSCGGTFCPNCLEMSVQHYRDSSYCCPVCSTPADIAEDFVPLTSAANHKPKTRIVTIPIAYRCESEVGGRAGPFLFSHPSLLNLPSNLTGEFIYGQLERILPPHCDFTVVLTDGQGLHCSRCLYMEHCSGCPVPRDGEVVLRPGDHLTVSLPTVVPGQVEEGGRCFDHVSMEMRRPDEGTSLMDCFTAFTQSEELDEQNPWFCPHCKENRRAKKTMTVWQYPDTLIIHLKRFLFHELSSTKVDNKVVFPTDDLNLNSFLSGPKTKNLQYNLYSAVCHFGGANSSQYMAYAPRHPVDGQWYYYNDKTGANSGHYTAYARHPVDGQWYYYNDETVTLQSPGLEEYSSTYVLFYQRKGTDRALEIAEDLDLGISALDTAASSPPPVPTTTGNLPSAALFQPPQREITLNTKHPLPSTSSCHQVAPSTGSVDLVSSAGELTNHRQGTDGSTNQRQSSAGGDELEIGSSHTGAEQAEADSTDVKYDFYS